MVGAHAGCGFYPDMTAAVPWRVFAALCIDLFVSEDSHACERGDSGAVYSFSTQPKTRKCMCHRFVMETHWPATQTRATRRMAPSQGQNGNFTNAS